MRYWEGYTKFSEEYLSKYHSIVFLDVFHKIKSFILYPPGDETPESPHTEELRKQIVLSQNLNALATAKAQGKSSDEVEALNYIMALPEDGYFKAHWQTAYPIWLIEQEIQERAAQNHFSMIYQLVWTLIRLGKTHQVSFFKEYRASMKEALEIILGDMPLKSKQTGVKRSLGGEKAYRKQLNAYKSVCHFIAAFDHLKQGGVTQSPSPFSLDSPSQIETFLQASCWFRHALLILKTPNIKDSSPFSEDILIPLPNWVESGESLIEVEPIDEVTKMLEEKLERAVN